STLDKLYSFINASHERAINEAFIALQNFHEFMVEPLVQFTQHPNESIRETLATTLGFNSSKESIQLLHKLLNDISLDVRLASINSFNRIGKLDGLVPLYQRYRESSDATEQKMISQIVLVLGQRNESPELIEIFNELFSGKDIDVENLADSLRENIALLDDLIKDKDPKIRLISLEIIKKRDLREKSSLVVRMLADADLDIRKTAVKTLAKIGDPTIIPVLTTAVEKTENRPIRDVFLHTLIEFKDPAVAPALVGFLADEDAGLKKIAADAFSQLGKEAITPLINALDSESPIIRKTIVETLTTFEKDVVPTILEVLELENPIVLKGAIEVLGEVGEQEHAKRVLPFLESENLGVQCASAWALSNLGTDTEKEMVLEITQTLINASKFPVEEIKIMASKALQSLAQVFPEIIEGMKKINDSVPDIQEQGITILAQVEPMSLLALKSALFDSNVTIRINATKVLSKIDSDEAIDLLLQMYQDTDETIRDLVFTSAIETEREIAIPALIEFLGDSNPERVSASIKRLVDHGSQSIEFAVKGLETPSSSIRKGCIVVLGKIKTDVPAETLLKSLSDSDLEVRLATIHTLGLLGSKIAVKEIGQLASTAPLEVQKEAVTALARIHSSSSAPILLNLLDSPDTDEKVKKLSDEALEAIIKANPDDGPLIAASKLIISSEPQEREQAISEFAKIGSPALETLEAYLENPKASVRIAALEALIQINDKSPVNSIVVRLQDSNIIVVQTALKALGILGSSETATKLIPFLAASEIETQLAAHKALEKLKAKEVLIEATKHKDITIRQHIIILLGEINATEAIPQITEFLSDSKNVIRAAAAKTLGMLQAESAIAPLLQLLSDKRANVVASAVLALSQLKAIRAIPWIYYISDSPDPLIQNAINDAKEKIGGDERLVPILSAFEQIFSPDYDINQSGIRNLSGIAPEFEDGILEGLKIPNDTIRALILQAIGLRGKKEHISIVLEYITGYSREVQISSIHALGLLKSVESISQIVEHGLSSKDEKLHAEAVNALVNIGSDGSETLVSFLDDKNKFVRAGAARVLGALKVEQYFDLILALVDDKNDEVKIASLEALQALENPKAVLKVSSILPKANNQVRIVVIDLLRALKGHEGLYQIFEMSRLSVPNIAEAANTCLEEFKAMEFVNEVLTTYTELIDNPTADVELHIRNLVPLGQSIVPLLSGAIYSKNSKIKELSIRVQGELGAKEYLHLWQEAMTDKEMNVRIASASALNRLPDESSIESLVNSLYDKHPEVRRLSLDTLIKIGSPSIPSILEHVSAKDTYVREAVFTFLALYGDSSSVSYLLMGLKDKDANVRTAAVIAVKKLDESRLIPFLVALENIEKDITVQNAIQDAISTFSQNSLYKTTIQMIEEIVQAFDQEDKVRSAVRELAQLGSDMLSIYRLGLQAPDDRIRAGIALVLSEMKDEDSMPQLIQFLQEKSTLLRDAVTEGLPNFGPSCIASLKDLIKHKDKDVRKRIAEILSNINTEDARIILAELISDKDSSIGKQAIIALRVQGNVAIPHIITGLEAKDKEIRKECILSLRDL
ncbi:MAG: HEAT repeat domain-containing protein, partial [Candidatus Hodarchaeota archaeon]